MTSTIKIELVPNLTATELIKSFQIMISRRGKPKTVYSDNLQGKDKEASKNNQRSETPRFLSRRTIKYGSLTLLNVYIFI